MKPSNWRRRYGYRPPPVPRYPSLSANWRYRTPPLRRSWFDWNAYIDRDYRVWFYQTHGRDLPPDLLAAVKRRRLHGKARRPPLRGDAMLGNNHLAALAERVRTAEREYKASDHTARVKLGLAWLEAHREFEILGGGTWKDWVAEHGDGRSLRDVRRLIALANDDNPEVAAEAERAKARDSMKQSRERTNVCPPGPTRDPALAKIEGAQAAPEQPTWNTAPAMPAEPTGGDPTGLPSDEPAAPQLDAPASDPEIPPLVWLIGHFAFEGRLFDVEACCADLSPEDRLELVRQATAARAWLDTVLEALAPAEPPIAAAEPAEIVEPQPRPDPRLEVPRAIAVEASRKGVTVTALPGAVYEVRDATGKLIAKADAMTVSDQIRALPDKLTCRLDKCRYGNCTSEGKCLAKAA